MTRPRVGPMVWVFGGLFLLVTALVAGHVTHRLDTAVYDQLTPVGSWNETHQLVSDIPDWTAPQFLLVAFAVFVAVLARRRHSRTPLVVGGLLVVVTSILVVVVKRVVARPDTGGHLTDAGSYPSGHMALTVAMVGGVLILLVVRPRWWQWALVALVSIGMAGCLLYGAIHWTSDVVGGSLLGATVLALACGVPGRAGVTSTREEARSRAPAP
jgi:membrane-associated phospholipid phosphatase